MRLLVYNINANKEKAYSSIKHTLHHSTWYNVSLGTPLDGLRTVCPMFRDLFKEEGK